MRRIYKKWPPKDVSPVGQEPRTLKQIESEYLAELRRSNAGNEPDPRTIFDNQLDKKALRDALIVEQKHICVYCESRIQETLASPPRIEHWRPLSKSPKHALDWQNLYLSCDNQDTCDVHKKNDRLAADDTEDDLPWPADTHYEDWVGFTRGGKVYMRADRPTDQAHRTALEKAIESILNLNHPTLVAARKAALDVERTRLQKDYPNRTASNDAREERAQALLEVGEYPRFVSIRVAWLTKSIGKNR